MSTVRKPLLAIVALIVAGMATAPKIDVAHAREFGGHEAHPGMESLEGVWATKEAACRDVDGVNRLFIHTGRLDWYETSCRAVAIRSAGPASWVARLSCHGEGDTFRATTGLRLTRADRLTMDASPVGPTRHQSYVRCTRI